MKKLMKNITSNVATQTKNFCEILKNNGKNALNNEKGDQNIGTAITILITICVGALLLGGLYTLFEDVVLPTVTTKVQEMFNYGG